MQKKLSFICTGNKCASCGEDVVVVGQGVIFYLMINSFIISYVTCNRGIKKIKNKK